MITEVTKLLGIQYPVIQGGTAWVVEHHLAAAVSEAGGLGLIGASAAPAEWVRNEIREAISGCRKGSFFPSPVRRTESTIKLLPVRKIRYYL